jgi:tetratricopeptide (TPR) repeat protein
LTREVKDVWSVQEEVARLIAKSLSLKLGVSSSVATASVNPEAYQLYLAARQAFNLSTPAGHNRAEELLSRALKLEPGLARAHAALSDVRRNQTQTAGTAGAFSQRNSPAMLSMLSPAQLAVSLDPDLPEAHEALGAAYWMAWRIEEAKGELGQAIALNPNYAAGHHMMARALLTDGRMDEALLEFRRAVELDPIFSRLVDNYSSALLLAGRPEEALAYADRALVLQPENKQALGFKAIALAMLGRGAEGMALARTLELDSTYAAYAAFVFALAGERVAAERVLARGPLTKSDACPLAALGRYDDCIAVIQAGALTANGVEFIYFFPSFDPIRHDPRFRKALAASGATEAHDRAQAWRASHPPEKPEAKK